MCLSLDDVTICVLYFSSFSTFLLVFYCLLQCWVCWQNLTGLLSIHSSNKQWKVIQCDVASFSRIKFYCQLSKQQGCNALRRYDSSYSRGQSRFAPIKYSPEASLILNCYLFFQKDQACRHISTSMWFALSDICVTTVNMRNVFYYDISNMLIVHSRYSYFDSLCISGFASWP